MSMGKRLWAAAAMAAATIGAAATATGQATNGAEWRTVAPENLLVVDTAHGRVLVELEPRIAPRTVAQVRTLADRGFYDGLKFHRVIRDFMAQTGDPLGTGAGGSDLPDVPGEFSFRRGREHGFASVLAGPQGQYGLVGSMPVLTQPDAQMMVTSDFKTGGIALFCPGVLGLARNDDPDSGNSQFFIMTAANHNLDGDYTAFGRVVAGLDAVRALKAGAQAENGRVDSPDLMLRARTAAAMPEAERPVVRVRSMTHPDQAAEIERVRAERGPRFTVCDIQPAAEVVD